MADHVAEQIVAAAKTALTGLATTGANAFDSRVYPVQHTELPAILIDQGDESELVSSMGGAQRSVEHDLDLVVIAKVEQTVSYRTAANTIRKEVEAALGSNNGLGGLCKWIHPKGFVIELSGEAEKPVASGTMTFSVRYYTALNAPDVPL